MNTKYRMFYKIDRENSGFSRIQLTKLGYIDKSINTVYTFKTSNKDRFLMIEFRDTPNHEVMDAINKKVDNMASVDMITDADEKFDAFTDFNKCFARELGKYLVHYEYARYNKID